MLVTTKNSACNGSQRRRRFRLPPGFLGMLAVLVLGWSALGQATAPATAPAQPAAAATTADPATAEENPNLFELFRKGGPVMWVLAASSVFALAIVIERFYALRRGQVIPPGFMDGLRHAAPDPRVYREAALNYCRQHDSPIGRMVAAGIKKLPRGHAAAEKAIEDAGANEALKLRANMRILYAIGSVATLLGLIGTIAGMIRAFMATAAHGEAENKVKLLSTGIYEAMVCTFGGLAVAILCTVFYYWFVGRIEKLVADVNDELTRFSDAYGFNAESTDELRAGADLMPPPLAGRSHAPAVSAT